MADKSFGVKQVNLINASGTPRIESPNNLNINAVNVAISTDISVGGQLSLGTGTSISSPGSNVLTLGTNSAERVRINSSGYIGIGTDNPAEEVHINGSTPSIRLTDTAGSNLITRITNSNGDLYFDANFGGSGNIYLRTVSGNVVVNSGNLVFSTSGTGIDFSANSNAAGMSSELLDDYEEGEWTPSIAGSTTAGTATYNLRQGFYTKVGRLVTVSLYVDWHSGTGTGNLQINGLPFTPVGFAPMAISHFDNISMTAGYYGGALMHTNGGIFIHQNVVGGGPTTNVPYDAQGGLILAGTFSATA